MERLWHCLVVVGDRIGCLEGKLEKFAAGQTKEKIKQLADAWNEYEKSLIPGK